MAARTLALFEQGLRVHLDGERLRIERAGELVTFARLGELDEILVFGAVELSNAAILACLRRAIDVLYLTRTGRFRGRLVGSPNRRVEVRMAQYGRLADPAFALELARSIVAGKLTNQRNLLLRRQRKLRVKDERLAEHAAALRLRLAACARAETLDVLRGVEGLAARAYFDGLARCIGRDDFTMRGRSRRPPRDAPNALLSFGYTLLAGLVESAILRAGLDPYLGSLHAAGRGHPSLTLDLMEELRPVAVDALMLRLVNRGELTPEDFDVGDTWDDDDADEALAVAVEPTEPPAEPGASSGAREPGTAELADEAAATDCAAAGSARRPAVWLSDAGRRIFFRGWGQQLHTTHEYSPHGHALTLEEILRQQVFHFARVLLGEDAEYRPFVPK